MSTSTTVGCPNRLGLPFRRCRYSSTAVFAPQPQLVALQVPFNCVLNKELAAARPEFLLISIQTGVASSQRHQPAPMMPPPPPPPNGRGLAQSVQAFVLTYGRGDQLRYVSAGLRQAARYQPHDTKQRWHATVSAHRRLPEQHESKARGRQSVLWRQKGQASDAFADAVRLYAFAYPPSTPRPLTPCLCLCLCLCLCSLLCPCAKPSITCKAPPPKMSESECPLQRALRGLHPFSGGGGYVVFGGGRAVSSFGAPEGPGAGNLRWSELCRCHTCVHIVHTTLWPQVKMMHIMEITHSYTASKSCNIISITTRSITFSILLAATTSVYSPLQRSDSGKRDE